MSDVRASWEERAAHYGDGLTGVLFRGLSMHANEAIDEWHSWIVREVFAKEIPSNGQVLDLGCGYGRLSVAMLQRRRDVVVTGVDVSLKYCEMYGNSVGAAVCADMVSLPFRDASFDGVVAVTSLMYAAPEERPMVLRELARITKPMSTVLLLDPGLEMQRLVGFLRGRRSVSPTGGHGFGQDEYIELARSGGFSVKAVGGNCFLSQFLLMPGVGGSERSFIKHALRRIVRLDCQEGGYSASALHRWILARRGDAM